MAKNLFEVVQSLCLLAGILALVTAAAGSLGDRRVRKGFLIAMLGVLALALVLSFLREKRIIKYNQINNIYLLSIAAAAGLAFTVLLWIDAVRGSVRLANQIAVAATGVLFFGALLCYRLPTIIVQPLHFVGKDESYFSTDYLIKLAGFLLAFLVLFLLVLSLHKILRRSSPKARASLATVLYLLNTFISFVAVVGIINSYYRRKFKLPTALRSALPSLIKAEDVALFAALAAMAAVSVAFFVYFLKIHGEYSNPAQHRRLKSSARNNRRWGAFLAALVAFVCVDLTVIKKASNRLVELSPSEEYEIDGNEIFIPLTQVSDGHLHRFTWTDEKGKGIRFIIVQKKGTNFGIGFDACEICGNVGYYERKNEVVCNRCDVVMNISTIGLKGGCNPIPLDSRIENGGIVILTEDLAKESKRF